MATVDSREKMARSRLLASAYTTASLLQSEEAIDRQVALLLVWMDEDAATGRPMASLQLLPSSYVVCRALGGRRARARNPDARWDYVAHWLRTHEKHPGRLTTKDVQAAVTSNVR